MKIIISPARETWDTLCKRPGLKREDLEKSVMTILNEVKTRGDRALFKFSEEFEGVSFRELKVTAGEILNSVNIVPDNLKEAIQKAKENIEKFHSAQLIEENKIETTFGVICWRKSVAIEKVGLYIPGGTAPLFSTILMLGIPATIAGCKEIIICTPPDKMGTVNPVILYTSQLLGINSIYKIGGAQAIAAMAFGTESVPKVYKIFGPGNQFVTKAKELVQQEGIAIDIPAGPSETLVIADYTCNPEFVAADLLSQAEHGPDSQVVLLTDNENVMQLVKTEIEKQLLLLPRKVIE
jgi:histidinol dehydrogenase